VARIVHGLRVHNAGDAAPAMAFHFFLSLVPVLVLVGFVLGHVVRQRGVDALLGPAIETAPQAAEQLVREELSRMAGASAASIAPLSVLGFLWIAATGTHGLMDAFEAASGAARRPWWKKRVIAMTWVSATLVALAVVSWGMLKIDLALHMDEAAAQPLEGGSTADTTARAAPPRAGPRHSSAPDSARAPHRVLTEPTAMPLVKRARHRLGPLFRAAWERFALLTVLIVAALGALAAFYRFAVEHPRGVKRRAWPGAMVALASWLLVSWGFGLYVSTLGRYALFYGSVATVAVLLVWFYLASWSLLIGAELNAQLEGLRDAPRS
jgi:membrane protein